MASDEVIEKETLSRHYDGTNREERCARVSTLDALKRIELASSHEG